MENEHLISTTKRNSVINLIAIVLGASLVYLRGTLPGLTLEILLFILSLVILVRAADAFTDMAVIVGERLGLSKLNIGILIIAIGTSAPELFASIGAALQNQHEIIVGNVLGTVIANCLLGIGIAALVAKRPLDVHQEVIGSQMSVFLVSILLIAFSFYDGQVSRFQGLLLLVVLGFYLHHNIKLDNPDNTIDANENTDTDTDMDTGSTQPPLSLLIILLAVNLICLFVSGDFVVSSLSNGAEILGLSSAKLATSLLAIGTSIPEIATAIMLVKKNNTDSLFGEIIGSNIFDLLGIFGIISLFQPIIMQGALLNYLILFIAGSYILLYVIMSDRKINRVEGVAFLSLFACFLVQLTAL